MGERSPEMIVLQGSGGPLADGLRHRGVHQPRQRRGPPVPDRPRRGGRRPRLRRDPLRLRAPARGRHVGDVLPGSGRPPRLSPWPASSPTPTPNSAAPTPRSACRCSASPPPDPEQIAQDIGLLAPHVDYVAPMVYPSHWGAGEYGVADPLRQPADIVPGQHRRLRPRGHRQRRRGRAVAAGLLGRRRGVRPGRGRAPRSTPPSPPGPAGSCCGTPGSFYTAEALQPRQPTGGVS